MTFRETFIDFLRTGLFLRANNGSHRSGMICVLLWVGWLVGNFFACRATSPSCCRATSEPNSFIQSCFKEILGGGRCDAQTFSFLTSPVSIRTTLLHEERWRSIEFDRTLEPLLLNKFNVNPIHRVLIFPMMYACTVQDAVLSSRLSQDLCVLFIHRIHRQKECCLSVAQILSSWCNPELMMECKLIAHPT